MEATAKQTPLPAEKLIEAEPGTYVEGGIDCMAGCADLILEEPGAPGRTLCADAQDVHVFRFVMRGPVARLSLRSENGAEAELWVSRVVPPGQQIPQHPVPPEQAPLSPRLRDVASGKVTAAAFWEAIGHEGAPMVEPDPEGAGDHVLMTFLYKGAQNNVRLVGGPAPDHVWMDRLAGTDIWFASFRVPGDLRLSYRLAPDVPGFDGTPRENRVALLAVAQEDPLARRRLFRGARGPYDQWSLVDLSGQDARPRQIVTPSTRTLSEHRIPDPDLVSGRRIWIHMPPGFRPGAAGNVLQILFDGEVYLHQLEMPCRLERAMRERGLPHVATVFVDAVSGRRRSEDLPCNDAFTRLLTDQIIPFAKGQIGQDFPAARTVCAGSSYGGLASAYAALTRPDHVGACIAMSGSFWWAPPGWTGPEPYICSLPADPALRAVLTAGCYEVARENGDVAIVETGRALAAHLRRANAFVQTRIYSGGHDYAIWEHALPDALVSLFAANGSQE